MQARNRTWLLGSNPVERCRQRTMNVEGGDGSTLSLDFTTGVLDPRLTFTRSTNATYINSSGYVTSAAINAPRFDYDPTTLTPRGLLIEGSANNLLTYSEDQGNNTTWSAFGTSVTRTTGQTDPGNNSTAAKLVFDATTADAVISRSVTVLNATQYTISMWMRADSGTVTNVRFARAAGSAGAIFPTLTTAWQRVSLTFTSSTTSDGIEIRVLTAGSPKTATVHLWGAQLEAGSGASSYIPTVASTVNRAADSCVMTGTNFSSWFAGATEGVLFVEYEKARSQSGNVLHDFCAVGSRYNVGQGFILYNSATTFLPTAILWPTGGAVFGGGIATAIPSVTKQAAKWFGGNDVTNYSNGVVGSTGAGTGTVTPAMLSFGANSATGTEATRDWLNACVRRVKFWPTALPNSELQSLTDLGDTSTLTLNFTTGSLDPRVSFSRAGGGTYIGPDGYIYGIDNATSSSLAIETGSKSVTLTATAGTNRRFEVGQTVYFSNGANNMSGAVTAYSPSTQVITINATATSGSGSFTSWRVGNASPRFDYNPATLSPRGLLIEGAADNICIQSENFGTWLKLQAADVVTANAGLSPDGQQNAYKISPSSVTGSHGVYRATTVSVSTTYTQSVYAKAGELNWLVMTEANTLTAAAYFDLATGTVGTVTGTGSPVAYMQNAGNGWWRCVFMFTTTGSQTSANIQVRPTLADNVFNSYAGNNSDGIYAWGAQAQAYALSSYIPTDASQRSRVADSVSMTGSNFSSWFNSSEGTFTLQYETVYSTKTLQSAYLLALDSSGSKRIAYLNTDLEQVGSYDGNSIINPTGDATGVVAHVASAYSATDRAMVLNGGTVATGTIAAGYSTATSLGIGTNVPFVTIKQIKFYPTRLTNAQMQGLTK